MSQGTRPEAHELTYETPGGEPVRFQARFGPDRPLPDRGPTLGRMVRLGRGWVVRQYRLPARSRGDRRAREALEREVNAAVAVERAHGRGPHAGLFLRVVGHDLDAEEPFVLYEPPPRGAPRLTEARLSGRRFDEAARQLVRAVRLWEQAGQVCRTLAPDTVWWHDDGIVIGEPYGAVPVGHPREPFGQAPWASPEQLAGTGHCDPRDDLWSAARLLYAALAGQPGPHAEPPPDLGAYPQLSALRDGRAFAPRAADRRPVAELLELWNEPDPGPAPPPGPARGEYARRVGEKRERLGLGPGPAPRGEEAPGDEPFEVVCPYCLGPVAYDPGALFLPEEQGEYVAFDPASEPVELRRADMLRRAFQLCPNLSGLDEHHLPVPYLTNGRPLTVVTVGGSLTGKTHLLTSMIGEIEENGLEPYGITAEPLNPEWHQRFVRERLQPLRDGRVLPRTASTRFARFADGLLLTSRGRTRPVMFFDLAGEDLESHDEAMRFLAGAGAFLFVVDPLRALRLPELERHRERVGIRERDLGDEAFAAVLSRVPRTAGLMMTPSAVVLNKSDLVRFEPAVASWLMSPPPTDRLPEALRGESEDVYAFLRHHGSRAWLRPFTDSARCTLHFVSATGRGERGGTFPHGVTPRRTLAPLLSLLAMAGMVEETDPWEVGL
ncbi:hypothetical protein SAMN06297387_109186 [Streptomyces zhaozhouensis]|uniref:Protein kinase domain-containing protein n=1 Tax=Streptomyces zhaozhouensis TaxID=1300267 RepID=A0A286DX76_9ACTN|nr:hypothetical protein [Streptomyces zhaozhouensis]SOD63243.1 hypothetical protein SAMN06297387_109186 [Streptomyces zhaozhouensis]